MTGLETFMEEVSGTALAATDTLANFLYKNALVSFVHLDCAAQRDHFLPPKCYLESTLNRADFSTALWGKSESRAWKYAPFLISSLGSILFPARSQNPARLWLDSR